MSESLVARQCSSSIWAAALLTVCAREAPFSISSHCWHDFFSPSKLDSQQIHSVKPQDIHTTLLLAGCGSWPWWANQFDSPVSYMEHWNNCFLLSFCVQNAVLLSFAYWYAFPFFRALIAKNRSYKLTTRDGAPARIVDEEGNDLSGRVPLTLVRRRSQGGNQKGPPSRS